MNKTSSLIKYLGILFLSLGLASMATAADRTVYVPLKAAVEAAQASGKIDGSVQFFLADAGPEESEIAEVLRTGIVTNKKTNAVLKRDRSTSLHVAQSAIIALHHAAKKAGADAVTNIVSYYRRNEYRDTTNIECHAGATVTGVALKGDLVKLKQPSE